MIDNKKERIVSDGEVEDYSEILLKINADILYRNISEATEKRDEENDDVK